MSRALVTFERTADGGWRPTVVWLATPLGVEAKELPGDARRTNWMRAILRDSQAPRRDPLAAEESGNWEDWVGWASNALSNGSDSWAVEVEPEVTLKALYEREILDVEPTPMETPDLRPSTVIPEGLAGYQRVEPK